MPADTVAAAMAVHVAVCSDVHDDVVRRAPRKPLQ
jgi:hypothetical protein